MKSYSKSLIVYLFSLVGCSTLFIFGFVNYFQGDVTAGLVEITAGVIGVLNALLLRIFKKEELAASVVLTIMLIIMGFLIFDGGIEGTGYLWIFVFPPLAFYMKELRKAIAWSIALLLVISALYVNGYSYYDIASLVQLASALVVVSVLVYFYALANKTSSTKIATQSENLIHLNKKLTEKLKERQHLDEAVADKNEELERSQKAMLNVLEDLEEEKSRDEAILENIGDGLVVVDAEGAIIIVNDTFEALLGWKKSDVLGKNFIEIVPMLDSTGELVPKKQRLLMSGSERREVLGSSEGYSYQRKDGSAFPVSVSVSSIVVSGKITGAVEVFRDVTQERAIDRAKTEFVSLASHQLRTPLSAIKWYIELLLSGDFGKLTKVQMQYMNEIAKGSQRMIELVGALLNVSRLELGTFSADPEKISIPDIITDVMKEHEQVIAKKKLEISLDVDETVPQLLADKKMARIVFENLISNAIKYTKEEGKVAVTLKVKKEKESKYVYTVKDSGIGIPQEQQGKIFEKLFRADNAREDDTDGTGLGLYLVKLILENMGGSITFKSKEGEGTTFVVTIPVNQKDMKA